LIVETNSIVGYKILLLRSRLPRIRMAETNGAKISGFSYRHRRDAYGTLDSVASTPQYWKGAELRVA